MAGEQGQGSAALETADDKDIEVILEGEAEGGAPDTQSSSEPDYAALKRDLEASQRERDALRRQADDASRAAQGAQVREIDANLGRVNSAIGEWTAETTRLKAELKAAHQSGDYDKVSDLTEKVGEAGSVMRDLQARKGQWEQAKKATPQPQRPGVSASSSDPVEAFAAGRPAQTQAWIRANPDFIRDPKKFQRLQGAHMLAVTDHAEGSPGYFDAVNATLGIKGAAAAPAGERRPAAVAAPVSRDAGSLARPASASPRSVTLTASEVAMAKQMNVPLKDYAREKAKLAAELARGEGRR